jgi:glutathionylspermidine synthase
MDKWLKAEREARGVETASMRSFLADERKQSSDFLREQRDAFNSTISRLAEKIDSISSEVSRLNGVLTAHDARAQERDRK